MMKPPAMITTTAARMLKISVFFSNRKDAAVSYELVNSCGDSHRVSMSLDIAERVLIRTVRRRRKVE